MGSVWKDFFYFQQSDKRAIILLLILIVICGGIAIFSDSLVLDDNIEQRNKSLSDFNTFQNNLEDKDVSLSVSDENTFEIKPQKGNSAANNKKLQDGETIEINGASIIVIKRIPGVGDEFAKRIFEYRNRLGGFVSHEQLLEIQGITPNKLKKISSYIEIKRKPKQLNLNKVSVEQLSKHPYINTELAKSIIDLRQKSGKIKSLNDLQEASILAPRDMDRLSVYFSFD